MRKTELMILVIYGVLRHNPAHFAHLHGIRNRGGTSLGDPSAQLGKTWALLDCRLVQRRRTDSHPRHAGPTDGLSPGDLDAAQRQAELACAELAESSRVDWPTSEGRAALQRVLRAWCGG